MAHFEIFMNTLGNHYLLATSLLYTVHLTKSLQYDQAEMSTGKSLKPLQDKLEFQVDTWILLASCIKYICKSSYGINAR